MKRTDFSHINIAVLGTVFLDIKGYPEGRFVPRDRNAGRIEYKYGGVARNVAEDLLGLGIRPVFISISDDKGMGPEMIRDLREKGVNTDHIVISENGIGTWMAIFDSDGDICANLSKRQDLTPVLSELDAHGTEVFSKADGILLEMDVEEAVVAKVFELAQEIGTEVYGVISNMNIARERIGSIRKTRCFVCNLMEAELLFGKDLSDKKTAELPDIIAGCMKEQGISCMVVTMGPEGAVYVDAADGSIGICPAEKADVVDTTGAGDSFFAGVSAGLISGLDIKNSCRIGSAMAAEVIKTTDNIFTGRVYI